MGKAKQGLMTLALLSIIFTILALTTPDHTDCSYLLPDEFLDLAWVTQDLISPILDLDLNSHPTLLRSLETPYFQEISLLATCLRC